MFLSSMFYHRNLPPSLLLLTLSVVLGGEQPEKGPTKENKKKKKCNSPQKAETWLEAPLRQDLLSQQEHARNAQQILPLPATCHPLHSALTAFGSKASLMSCKSLSSTNVPSSLVCMMC